MILEDLTKLQNLKRMVDYAAENFADRDFIQYKVASGIEAKKYSQLKSDCDAFSLMIEAKGLVGAHVAVIGPTSYNWIVTYLGTAAAESVIVPLATAETVEMNCRLVDFADVDVLVFDKKSKPLYEAVKSSLPRVRLFISVDDDSSSADVLNFSDILKEYAGNYEKEPDAEKTCAIMFTSGTTGFPKGVMLSHKNLVYSATSVHVACPTTKMFCCLPIYHGFCFTANITKSICRGKTVCVNDNLANIVENLRLFRPDSIIAVPQIVKKLMNGALKYAAAKPELSERDAVNQFLGGNIIDIISGGAPLDAALNERFNATGILVLNGYGMTECSPIISNNSVGSYRHGSVGMPIPCMDVKIVNGEILAKGPSVMQGYYKNPEATAEVFTEDGYLHTGDLGHFDEDGFLYITGRCKNLILLDNGENVSAEMLEDRFSYEPIVQEVVCFGEDGVIYAEIYPNKEYIQSNNITDVDAAMTEMLMRVNSGLAAFQRVSAFILRDTPFERTASSKIKRGAHGKVKKKEAVLPVTYEEQKVFDAVKELLSLKELSMTDNFFAVGGDSLNAVELALSLNVNPQLVYDNPFLNALADKLASANETETDGIRDINALLAKAERTVDKKKYSAVLLTGATGFLGIHILKELLSAGIKVYCLVRNEKRLLSQIEYYFGSLDMTGVEIVEGNIEQEKLGISEEKYSYLSAAVDAVYHVAANVHHAGDYEELRRTNVQGTKNVISFCFDADAVLHHTSTVSVHGAATVRQSFKNAVFDENILDIGQHYTDNVYIHSKYRAEEAVIEARTKGLKANIYRIGNLTWRASDGRFQKNSEDNGFLRRIRAMLKLGLYHENMDKYPMDLTAVDECADAYVKLSLTGRVNEIYHLYNPNFLASRELFDKLGVSYRHVSTNEAIETAFANTDDRDIHVYLFYMIISGRSQNIPMKNDFTMSRLSECGFRWGRPDKAYLTACSDGGKGLCLDFEPVKLLPMRKTGGMLNPIQKLTLGVLKKAYPTDSKIIRGAGKTAELKKELELLGVRKPLVITIQGAKGMNGIKAFLASLNGSFVLYDSVIGEPTVADTDEALRLYSLNGCDCVVGIGGGSVLDTAKITALRANNENSDIEDICKLESDAAKCVPLLLVPTTAGTGSEVTLFAVATEEKENKKRPFVSDKYLPDVIVLDPVLTLTVPPRATAYTGLDALSHAIESYVSLFADSFSEDARLAPEVCKDIFSSLEKAVSNPDDIKARQLLQNAAFNAGLSFRRIGTGYIHAVGHRLGELYHIPHGLSVALCIAPMLRAYMPYGADRLSELSVYCGFGDGANTDEKSAEAFIEAVQKLIERLGISSEDVAFCEKDIDGITRRAQEEAKIVGSPRPFSDDELKNIILSIFR